MQKIQTRSIYAVLLLLVCGIAGVLPDAAQAAPPGFSSCQLGAENSSIHLQAKCASMLVPEDHAQPNAGKIRLHVAVLSARSGKPVHDAMFFLAGGPGQAATEAFVDEAAAFSALQLTRDIVLVDQRGTGESNPLNCPPQPEGADSINEVHVVAQTRACLKQLKDNPRFYTTTEAVRDLDAVRAALGYSTVDLYGVSYGTRVALEYLREFPSRVRSVVLDGVVPPDWNIGANLSTNAQRALNSILTRCELSTACHQAYPSLQQNFITLRRDLMQHPATVQLRNPANSLPVTRVLDWNRAGRAIYMMSYSSDTAALIPFLLHRAGTAHDYTPLMAQSLMLASSVRTEVARGMNLSVLCTEDVPFYTSHVGVSNSGTSLGNSITKQLMQACRVWPKGVIEPNFKKSVVSDKPVLLLSGQDDPITPPSNAMQVAKTLSNSLSVVVPDQGHGNAVRGCIPNLITQFVEKASIAGLDTHCVDTIRAFPFFTDSNGPAP